MNNKKNLIFFLVFFLLTNCSFDTKTGIWTGQEYEKKRVEEIEEEQTRRKNFIKIYSSKNSYSFEKSLNKKIILSKPKKNSSWQMHGLNLQNFLGNIYLTGIKNQFLKEKIGKNKISISKISSSPIIYNNSIILSDDKGTVYYTNEFGQLIWKLNIYKKIYKKIYKSLTLAVYKNNIYVADNIGLIYSISLQTGKLIWIKNHGVPLKSKIKIYNDKIYLINQDNRLLAFSTKDGSIVWGIRTASSFIKSQHFLSLALTKTGDVIASTSSGNLMKINSQTGRVNWSLNSLEVLLTDATDFFKSSDIVLSDESIIFSTETSIFSYNIVNGFTNWKQNVSSVAAPIIDGKNIFLVTENGFFVILDVDTGEIISSSNILNILKEKKQSTEITGFIMGSGKLYIVTYNGYLIVASSLSGKSESFVKIGHPITSTPIINDGKLFIYTEKSRILGFN